MPLWLQSYATALLGIVPISILVTRICFEQRLLGDELRATTLTRSGFGLTAPDAATIFAALRSAERDLRCPLTIEERKER